jgi:hypothetical protein
MNREDLERLGQRYVELGLNNGRPPGEYKPEAHDDYIEKYATDGRPTDQAAVVYNDSGAAPPDVHPSR